MCYVIFDYTSDSVYFNGKNREQEKKLVDALKFGMAFLCLDIDKIILRINSALRVRGSYWTKNQVPMITISDVVSTNQMIETLFHELTHLYQDRNGKISSKVYNTFKEYFNDSIEVEAREYATLMLSMMHKYHNNYKRDIDIKIKRFVYPQLQSDCIRHALGDF